MEIAEKTAFLGTGQIVPTLLRLGIPAAVGLLINTLMAQGFQPVAGYKW